MKLHSHSQPDQQYVVPKLIQSFSVLTYLSYFRETTITGFQSIIFDTKFGETPNVRTYKQQKVDFDISKVFFFT